MVVKNKSLQSDLSVILRSTYVLLKIDRCVDTLKQ